MDDARTAAPARAARARAALRAAAPLVAAAAVASLAGCTYTNPQWTTRSYLPTDGLVVALTDDVVVTSLLVVTEAAGEPGALVARLTNSTAEPHQVSLSAEGLSETVSVPAYQTVALGGVAEGSQAVVIDPVDEAPGLLMPMTVALEGSEQAQEVSVPVLDGTLEEYEPYLAVAAGEDPGTTTFESGVEEPTGEVVEDDPGADEGGSDGASDEGGGASDEGGGEGDSGDS